MVSIILQEESKVKSLDSHEIEEYTILMKEFRNMNHIIPEWNTYFMSLCYLIATRSKDPSTKVGCVIVGPDQEIRSTGYNSLPRHMDDNLPERFKRPLKYSYFEHAERNAIYNAARYGASLLGCSLYITWLPCIDCARAIVQSGISKVIVHKQGQQAFLHSRGEGCPTVWDNDHKICKEMLIESGLEFEWYDGPIQGHIRGYFSGKLYSFNAENNNPVWQLEYETITVEDYLGLHKVNSP
jgi:dCMP deaminase